MLLHYLRKKVIKYLEFGFIKGVGTLTFGVMYWQQLVKCF